MFLFGMLGASGGCLAFIFKVEAVYVKLWGSDVATQAWRRKRWAFISMLTAQVVGVISVFTGGGEWVTLVYVALMFLSLCLLLDSYRILLVDLKKLPRKRE